MKKITFSLERYKKKKERPEDAAQYASKKRDSSVAGIDEKTVLYLCSQYFTREYGRRGSSALCAQKYKNTVLFVGVESALWAQEVWMQRDNIMKHINTSCGARIVTKIVAQVR